MNTSRLPNSSTGVHVCQRASILGFTLFELLAALTVIAIGLSLIVGSYNSWGTAHALTGATRTVEAGLQQARTLAMSQRTYVVFTYGTTNSTLSRTTGFQPFFCTNINETAVSETDLNFLADAFNDPASTFLPLDGDRDSVRPLILEPATPFQRLSGHVRLTRLTAAPEHLPLPTIAAPVSIIVFRPDGSIVPDTIVTQSPPAPFHTIVLETITAFPRPDQATTAPLSRLFRIDPATGLTTIIGEPTP